MRAWLRKVGRFTIALGRSRRFSLSLHARAGRGVVFVFEISDGKSFRRVVITESIVSGGEVSSRGGGKWNQLTLSSPALQQSSQKTEGI